MNIRVFQQLRGGGGGGGFTLINCGFCGRIIAKNELNRPYLSS